MRGIPYRDSFRLPWVLRDRQARLAAQGHGVLSRSNNMPRKSPKINQLLHGVAYIGKAATPRTLYFVFQTRTDYLIFSFRDATHMSGNFNVVTSDTVEKVYNAFKGQKRVTSGDVASHPQMRKFRTRFEALHALYVLVAKKQASIDRRSRHSMSLFFNLKR